MRRLTPALLALVACGGGGGGEDGDAADTIRTAYEAAFDGQTGRVYDLIHPAQQELVDRDTFIACDTGAGAGELDDFEVEETYREQVTIPGTDVEVEAVAVTFRIEIGGQADTLTRRALPTDDGFRIGLSQEQIDAYLDGDCP